MRCFARALSALAAAMIFAAPALSAPAATAFDRLAALAGEWTDLDGVHGKPGEVVVTYRTTGAGSAVVETLFPGQAHEMTTVYHRDGGDLVLTHYCAAGNQPRMRAKTANGDSISFEFEGGANLDPAKDSHMHSGSIEFLSPDEIRARWVGFDGGRPSPQPVVFHLARRKPAGK